MALVSYVQLKGHLRITSDDEAEDLTQKSEQATAMVITYIKRPDHTWTMVTDPSTDLEFAIVQSAILQVIAEMYQHRGDEQDELDVSGGLSARVRGMLSMLRDPALA